MPNYLAEFDLSVSFMGALFLIKRGPGFDSLIENAGVWTCTSLLAGFAQLVPSVRNGSFDAEFEATFRRLEQAHYEEEALYDSRNAA